MIACGRRTTSRLLCRVCAFCGLAGPVGVRADTVALWHFDAPTASGVEAVPGKFGQAFRPARRAPVPPSIDRPPGAAWRNPTDSRLNLGAGDWTLECWLRLDPGADEEGVIFELGTGPRGANELVTRFSVLPRENAFAFAGLVSVADGVARRVEFANAEGPPAGEAWLQTVTLPPAGSALPRERWFHVALVQSGADGGLRLYVDGRAGAVAAARWRALPRGDEAYLALGRDGQGRRGLAGALDEVRVSDTAVYAADFAPPASLVPRPLP